MKTYTLRIVISRIGEAMKGIACVNGILCQDHRQLSLQILSSGHGAFFLINHEKRQSNLWNNLDTQDCEASQDKSETHARCQHPLEKIDMIHITILEPEGMPIFEKSDA